MNSLSTSLSAMFVFGVSNFIPEAYGKKNRHQKIESIYGAGFWSMCHGYYTCFST